MPNDNDNDKFAGTYWRYTGVGFELIGSLAVFALIGYAIDRHWHTGPMGMVIGALVGIVVGLYLVIKEALKMNASDFQPGSHGPAGTDREGKEEKRERDERKR